MKNFLQEYGTAILACCMTIMMIGVASPVSETIQVSTGEVVASFSDKVTGEEEGGGMRALDSAFVSSGVMEENVPDTIYVGYNSLNQCLVFSHSDESEAYSACNLKFGDVSNEQGSLSNNWHDCLGSSDFTIHKVDAVLIENKIKPKNMCGMFSGLSRITSIEGISNIDTSQCTNMAALFSNCNNLTSVDLSRFDTSNVTDMSCMFKSCYKLENLNLASFKTSNVVDMENMFGSCCNITSLDLSMFDTSKVTSMYSMFNGCTILTSLDVSSFDTSNVTTMCDMFSECREITNLDISNFNTTKVNSFENMFRLAKKLTTIVYGDAFVKGSTTKTSSMFYSCPANKPSWW